MDEHWCLNIGRQKGEGEGEGGRGRENQIGELVSHLSKPKCLISTDELWFSDSSLADRCKMADGSLMPLPEAVSGLDWSHLVDAARAFEGNITSRFIILPHGIKQNCVLIHCLTFWCSQKLTQLTINIAYNSMECFCQVPIWLWCERESSEGESSHLLDHFHSSEIRLNNVERKTLSVL